MTGTAAADVKDPLKPDKPVRNHNLIQKQSDFPSMRFNLTCNTTLEDVTSMSSHSLRRLSRPGSQEG